MKKLLVLVIIAVMTTMIPVMADAASTPGRVKLQGVSCETKNTVKITWKKAKYAKSYEVYKKTGSKWRKVKTVNKTSFKTEVEYGKKTYFKIRAKNGTAKGKFSKIKTITIDKIGFTKGTISLSDDDQTTAPFENKNKDIKWHSDNENVATISDGVIKAVSPGATYVTAGYNGQISKMRVYVNGFVDVSSAYTLANDFRTSSGVWFWNKDNKTKTYYNKDGAKRLKALKVHSKIEKAARIRAEELSESFSHLRPNGTFCYELDNHIFGENIASGYSAEEVIEAWKETNEKYEGQKDRRYMLMKEAEYMGIACYMYNGTTYWVQLFACKW